MSIWRLSAIVFAVGTVAWAWMLWPRSEADRWAESESCWWDFLSWFDFF